MATFTYPRSVHCATLTLTTHDTKYALWTLIQAVDSTIPKECRELVIQADVDNGSAKVRIGNVNLSTTQYGYTLLAGASRTYVHRNNLVDTQDFYVLSSADGAKICVELVN